MTPHIQTASRRLGCNKLDPEQRPLNTKQDLKQNSFDLENLQEENYQAYPKLKHSSNARQTRSKT